MGDNVQISRVAVAQGNLTVRVTETPQVSQPNPLADGRDRRGAAHQIEVDDQAGNRRMVALEPGVTLKDLVDGLNALGVGPRDMIWHPAGHQGGRRAAGRDRGDVMVALAMATVGKPLDDRNVRAGDPSAARRAAEEFEAVFLGQILRGMMQGLPADRACSAAATTRSRRCSGRVRAS